MLWAMFYWETSSSANLVDVTLTRTTYQSIVVRAFMETVFPDVCGLFQQDNVPESEIESLSI